MDWQGEAGQGELFRIADCKPLRQRWYCLAHAWVWHLCGWCGSGRRLQSQISSHRGPAPLCSRLAKASCATWFRAPSGSRQTRKSP